MPFYLRSQLSRDKKTLQGTGCEAGCTVCSVTCDALSRSSNAFLRSSRHHLSSFRWVRVPLDALSLQKNEIDYNERALSCILIQSVQEGVLCPNAGTGLKQLQLPRQLAADSAASCNGDLVTASHAARAPNFLLTDTVKQGAL